METKGILQAGTDFIPLRAQSDFIPAVIFYNAPKVPSAWMERFILSSILAPDTLLLLNHSDASLLVPWIDTARYGFLSFYIFSCVRTSTAVFALIDFLFPSICVSFYCLYLPIQNEIPSVRAPHFLSPSILKH